MDLRALVVYHTVEGQTAKIAERIADRLRDEGVTVDIHPAATAPAPNGYFGVVVGGSIHAVHHSRKLTRYLQRYSASLNELPTALFQVSMTSANPDAEHTSTAYGLVDELLGKTGFEPDAVGLFAGALAYTKYGWLKRMVMRHISKKEHGETDTSREWDYTDWDAVDRFATAFAARVNDVPRTFGRELI